MKLALTAAIAATIAASALIPAPTRADQSIIVESQRPTLNKWVSKVSQDLTRSLDNTLNWSVARDVRADGGYTAVTFTSDEAGRPAALTVARPSGDKALDRVALTAVEHLRSLHPMPASLAPGQRFRANIIISVDSYKLDRLVQIMRKEEAQRIRAEGPNSKEIVLTAVPSKSA
ncbi:MAG: energy transducer TonB [Sphingomonadales bacterium]|nr:energy transducer TonB [Sphingomonadales bacterium]